jgi:Low-density lipoprotein receptor domain class A
MISINTQNLQHTYSAPEIRPTLPPHNQGHEHAHDGSRPEHRSGDDDERRRLGNDGRGGHNDVRRGQNDVRGGQPSRGDSSQSCTRNEWQCSSGDCIPLRAHCDGRGDCSDFSDERNCRKFYDLRHTFIHIIWLLCIRDLIALYLMSSFS